MPNNIALPPSPENPLSPVPAIISTLEDIEGICRSIPCAYNAFDLFDSLFPNKPTIRKLITPIDNINSIRILNLLYLFGMYLLY